jgi:hypothetical protein
MGQRDEIQLERDEAAEKRVDTDRHQALVHSPGGRRNAVLLWAAGGHGDEERVP